MPPGVTQPDNGLATMGRGQWLTFWKLEMPTVTVQYNLPEEKAEFDAARLGTAMAACLWDIDQHCRTVVKYEAEPSEDRVRLAEEIRQMIVDACPDALEM